MAAPSIATSVIKLAVAGEQAGFTVEQMIELLNTGVTVEFLLQMIERRLTARRLMSLSNPVPPAG